MTYRWSGVTTRRSTAWPNHRSGLIGLLTLLVRQPGWKARRAVPDVNPTLAIARRPGLQLLTCPGQVEIGRWLYCHLPLTPRVVKLKRPDRLGLVARPRLKRRMNLRFQGQKSVYLKCGERVHTPSCPATVLCKSYEIIGVPNTDAKTWPPLGTLVIGVTCGRVRKWLIWIPAAEGEIRQAAQEPNSQCTQAKG